MKTTVLVVCPDDQPAAAHAGTMLSPSDFSYVASVSTDEYY